VFQLWNTFVAVLTISASLCLLSTALDAI